MFREVKLAHLWLYFTVDAGRKIQQRSHDKFMSAEAERFVK